MENISPELRLKCHRVCSEYLAGAWKTVTADSILIEKFTAGLVNLTLKVSLPFNIESVEGEPTQVIIKIDLGFLGGSNFRRMTENIIALVLGEKGLAPKVYGILEDGRMDEYIPSRNLMVKDLENPTIIEALAKTLAQIHSLNIPLGKTPNRFFNFGNTFLDAILNEPKNGLGDPKRNQMLSKLKTLKPQEDLVWLRKLILSVNAPIVCSHGDFQVNNILLPPGFPDRSLYVVDFDVSGYSYRGTDFAGLFNSFCMVMPYPEPPYIKCNWKNFPSLSLQKSIIRIYLEEFQKINNLNYNFEEEEKQILRESEVFLLVFYYLLFIYTLARKEENKQANKMDWIHLSELSLARYLELKSNFINNRQNDVNLKC